MANSEHVRIVKKGAIELEAYRRKYKIPLDLTGADLEFYDLACSDLRDADMTGADLGDTNLTDANLGGACLTNIREDRPVAMWLTVKGLTTVRGLPARLVPIALEQLCRADAAAERKTIVSLLRQLLARRFM